MARQISEAEVQVEPGVSKCRRARKSCKGTQASVRKRTQILARPFGEADVRFEAHGHAGNDSGADALAREDEPRSNGEKETHSHGETRTGRGRTRDRKRRWTARKRNGT